MFAPLLDLDDREQMEALSLLQICSSRYSKMSDPLFPACTSPWTSPRISFCPRDVRGMEFVISKRDCECCKRHSGCTRSSDSMPWRPNGRTAWLKVNDMGAGIDWERSAQFFEPFAREIEISRERRGLGLGGMGLGLTIVRMIADQRRCKVQFVKLRERLGRRHSRCLGVQEHDMPCNCMRRRHRRRSSGYPNQRRPSRRNVRTSSGPFEQTDKGSYPSSSETSGTSGYEGTFKDHCLFDGANVLILDYDLYHVDEENTRYTGEGVAHLARVHSECGLIVVLNQFMEAQFDLSLRSGYSIACRSKFGWRSRRLRWALEKWSLEQFQALVLAGSSR